MFCTNTGKKAILLVLALLLIAVLAGQASAYTSPYKLMVFTDKQVYLDYAYNFDTLARETGNKDNAKGSFNQKVNVFAVLLDSDGNIVRGLAGSNFSSTLKDVERFNHSGQESFPFYQVIPTNGAYYPSSPFPPFTDADGDGIYNSSLDVTDLNQLASPPPVTDHINISINVTVSYMGTNYRTNVSVLFGVAGCHHPESKTITSAHAKTNHNGVVCTACHWGYQYALGVHGANNSVMNNDAARYMDPDTSVTAGYDYKLGYVKSGGNATTWDNSNASFCVMCHGGPTNANILDLGAGSSPASSDQNADLLNDGNRPSCSWYQGPMGNNSAYPVCHGPQQGFDGSTRITVSTLNGTDWKGISQGAGTSRTHNHTAAPKTTGISCELCHAGGGVAGTGTGGMHLVVGLPNMTSDYSNINDQCQTCHNVTDGWLNITANGGTAKNHSKTNQCSRCHVDNNKLNSHNVPTGAYGGKWCLNCHNLTGTAPIDMKIDPAVPNISNINYTHYRLNRNSDAQNSSRICWGCHTNNSVIKNGRVNSTSLPEGEHAEGYDTPRSCTKCHNNSNATLNFGAPQTYRHTWYASDMNTPAVTYCVNCHATDEMLISWDESVFPPKNGNESASHYGRNRTSTFPPVGSREYCGYCHQNESTVMGPFAKPDNEIRSDHASQNTTPGCGDTNCHKPGRMHEDTLVVPNFNESNIASTCLACHSPADYSFHNSTITCWDCHMGNVSSSNSAWIHPIQFVQYNGNFTGAKLTSATCYDCHKSSRVDNVTRYLSGRSPPKIFNQAHSNDPGNGTKWGEYWKYTPTTYNFASYYITSGIMNPALPFDNIRVPSNDYMELKETQNGSSNGGSFPYTKAEQEINGPPVPNWTYSSRITAGTSTITSSQDGYFGAPAGSLKTVLKTTSASGSGTVSWNYSFYYKPNSTEYAYANASVDYLIDISNVSSARTQYIYFRLIKPSGTVVTLANASCCAVAGNSGWITLRNDSFSSELDEDGSTTPYRIQLYAVLSAGKPNTNLYKVYFDNIRLKFHEKVWNMYEIIINTTGVPTTGNSRLGMSYQMHMESSTLMIYNRTLGDYEYLDTMDKGVFFDYVKDINTTHHVVPTGDGNTGNVSVKFVDNDRSDIDEFSDVLHIRYLYIFSDQGLQYPCEQCHSPNKHYVNPTIGSPEKFRAGNRYNSSDLGNSTWCQQCHWQGAANYSKMIQEFNVTRNPPENIPPEITGNKTYGNFSTSKNGKTSYVNHTGSAYSDMNDSGCFKCHGKAGDITTSQFIHNIQVGQSGNRRCTTCHNTSSLNTNYKKVDVEAVRRGMHGNLKNASANVSNASDPIELACWACHGDGTYINPEQHRNANAWSCDRCHTSATAGKLGYNAPGVYEHIPPNLANPESDIRTTFNATSWACADCHNNSINSTALINDNEYAPNTAIAGHYGVNRTAGMLMYDYSNPPKGNSENCIYCHKGGSANMTKWGINTSSAKNLSNKVSSTDHRTFTNNDCGGCHNYTVTTSFTFHNASLTNGSGGSGGSNCIFCHNIGGSRNNVNFSVLSMSMHATLNSGAQSTPENIPNKPCWGCHGTLNGKYANESDQPASGHNTSVYKSPRKCYDCHITGNLKLTTKNVTDHIQAGYTAATDVKTSSYCSICHNNSVNNGYESDAMGIGGINPANASVSHYGSSARLIETLGNVNTSQGCIYCHYDLNNSASWGSATDPRTSIVRPHVETQNSQCWGCHVQGVSLPSTFHNETLFAGGGGGTAPTVPSGSSKLRVATNRYVILDDPTTGTPDTAAGFANPGSSWGTTNWVGKNTIINATALYVDDYGKPVQGKNITFRLYRYGGVQVSTATVTTDSNGLANFGFDLNANNYYGKWRVSASNDTLGANATFIYNWWGCAVTTVCSGHNSQTLQTGATANSPYLNGRDRTTGSISTHYATTTKCTFCHQSFDGLPGGSVAVNYSMNTSDVHRNVVGGCANSSCHGDYYVHGRSTTTGNAVIPSCYNTSGGCHITRPEISNKSTLDRSNIQTALSLYSINSTSFNATFHTPNSTIPCIICHGPMHNISKPDTSQWNIRNNVTESSQCTTCHLNKSHSQNRAVNCSMCHSPDAHAPKFITNQTTASVANYTSSRSSAAGCKDCHNNTGINSYFTGKGYSPKKNDAYTYNLTNHNNVVSCNTCHDRLHWIGYINSTGMYQTTATGAVTCLDCHSGTNTNVSGTVSYWGYMAPARSRHNNSVSCESCHSGSKHGIRFLQPDRISFGSKITPVTCVNCHQQGYSGAPRVPVPINHSTNPYSGALWNGTQQSYWDNTSQLSTCNYCHGAVLHSTSPLGNSNIVKGNNNMNQSLTNGYWCANCHYKNAPGYAGNLFAVQPPEVLNANGLVPGAARDGTLFFNHSNDLSATYDDARCRLCHNNYPGVDSTSLNFIHNTGTGATGGSNCISCHDIGGSKNNVNFSASNMSMHATLNSGAQSAPQTAQNKPCWGCHGTLNGAYANESDQPASDHNITVYKNPRKCYDCHITGSLKFTGKNVTDHIPSGYTAGTDVSVISYCSYCHNNSANNGYEPDAMGITGGSIINASVSHYGANRSANRLMATGSNSTDCVFCHRNSTNMIKWGIIQGSLANISNKNASGGGTDHDPYTLSNNCSQCHGNYVVSSSFTFHNSALGSGVGSGPDCKSCHDVGGSVAGKLVNFSAMNDTNAIHRNLNNGAIASVNIENRKCWACHDEGTEPTGHNSSRYKTPYKCEDCHTESGARSGKYPGWNVNEHVRAGTVSGTELFTPLAGNCYSCHNTSEMMVGTNLDPDGASVNIYGGENGGSNSTSHYGRKRNLGTGDAYCNYCHNNATTVFGFQEQHNKKIYEHTGNSTADIRNATTMECIDCHTTNPQSYRIHNSTLNILQASEWTAGRQDRCAPCHKSTGNGSNLKVNNSYHNTSTGNITDCSYCHNSESLKSSAPQNIHSDNLTKGGSPAFNNCYNCHENGFASKAIFEHTSNSSANITNSSMTCEKSGCHNSNKTHSNALVTPSISEWTAGEQDRCAPCHRTTGTGSTLKVNNSYHNTTSGNITDCSYCHNSESVKSSAPQNVHSRNLTKGGTAAYRDCYTCHQNGFASKAIFEHTNSSSANITNTSMTCNNSGCHKSDRTHSGNLVIPSVSIWTSGKQDRCAPCHKSTGAGSTLKVNNSYHNTTTGNITDCSYCHDSDSLKSSAPQNIHSKNLTKGGSPAFNNCYTCHQNGFASKAIFEHTNSSSANITNASMTCEKSGCHNSNKTHSKQLIKPATSMWTPGGNDYCVPCHKSSDSENNATKKVFNSGHDPAGSTIDNISSCANCHNTSTPGAIPSSFRLHDSPLTNLSGRNESTCRGCHNGTIAFVGQGKVVLSHMPDASQYRGNTSDSGYTCELCHNMTGKISMHSTGMDRSNGTCDTCHFNNTSPFKSLTKNITMLAGGMVNHTYDGRDRNTCNTTMCHNASGRVKFHLSRYAAGDIVYPQDSAGYPTFLDRATWSGDTNDKGMIVDCRDCHEKYNDTAPFFAPVMEANRTGVNNQEHVGKGYKLTNCYVCHTAEDNVSKSSTMHNVSIEPLTGGPGCKKCHDISSQNRTQDYKLWMNVTAFNSTDSVHRSFINATLWNGSKLFESEDTACWVCHQSDGKQPERHTDKKDEAYKAYKCADCHTIGGTASLYQPAVYSNSIKISKHYPGSVFLNEMVFTDSVGCSICHKNSLVADTNITGYPNPLKADDINASHYGTRTYLINTSLNLKGCQRCHGVGANGSNSNNYGNARQVPGGHNIMGSKPIDCETLCHNSAINMNISIPVDLHNNSVGVNVESSACNTPECHTPPPPPPPDEKTR